MASSGPSTIREAAIQRAVPLPATTAMERYGRSCAVSGVDACMAVVREWLLAPDSVERASAALEANFWRERRPAVVRRDGSAIQPARYEPDPKAAWRAAVRAALGEEVP